MEFQVNSAILLILQKVGSARKLNKPGKISLRCLHHLFSLLLAEGTTLLGLFYDLLAHGWMIMLLFIILKEHKKIVIDDEIYY